jgi:hypothetical protein
LKSYAQNIFVVIGAFVQSADDSKVKSMAEPLFYESLKITKFFYPILGIWFASL